MIEVIVLSVLILSAALNAGFLTGMVTLTQPEPPIPVPDESDPIALRDTITRYQQLTQTLQLNLTNTEAALGVAITRADTAEDQLSEVQSDIEDYIDQYGSLEDEDEE